MFNFLGIDTSNYTTSAAIYVCQENAWESGQIFQRKNLLPVKEGQLGLRQSDAVFHHVQQLPEVLSPLIQKNTEVKAIGVSTCPRRIEGSYMPCFTVGQNLAEILSGVYGVSCYSFSHQEGHIVAALYSAEKLSLLGQRFLAFHVSGGTTEAVLVSPQKDNLLHTALVASSLDLKGGQAVDRVGAMLGLKFPAGKELEKLALSTDRDFQIKPSMKGRDCSLSGIENKCQKMLKDGFSKPEIARYCLQSILAALDGMCGLLLKEYGDLPVLFAGGVMSNSIIREALSKKYGAFFAKPEFSTDNAAGIAILAAMKEGGV